jgi:AcrR family transcriptional regulator
VARTWSARSAELRGPVLTVTELAAKSGVPVPSIHHYRRLGLLPEPLVVGTGRYRYDERHLDSLAMVRLLREERRLPLSVIGELMPELLAGHHHDAAPGTAWEDVVAAYFEQAVPSLPPARLLAAARRRFADRGYDAVSVGEICEAAGIAKGTFYRYYGSKDEIFAAAARSTVDAVGERLDDGPRHVSEQQAVEELERLMRPMFALYLEVVTRGLRGDARSAGLAASIREGLVARVAPRLRAGGSAALEAGRRVVDGALVGLLPPSVDPG